jgi:S1-C subfamily serine protease
MKRFARVAGVAAAIMLPASAPHAEVYKWTDAEGRVHFSDKPPPRVADQPPAAVEHVRINDAFGTFKIPRKRPLHNPGDARSMALERFAVRLDASNSRGVTSGRVFAGRECDVAAAVQWNAGEMDVSAADVALVVAQRFRDAGWSLTPPGVPGASSLSLEAEVVDLKADFCIHLDREWRPGEERAARAYVKVRWVLREGGEEVHREVSEGAEDGWRTGGTLAPVFQRAIAQAADNVLAQQAFADAVRGAPDAYGVRGGSVATAPDAVATPVAVALTWGEGEGRFQDRSEQLLAASVTVRTLRGHGSGVVVDPAGYALTNAHVVGDERHVTLVVDGRSVPAQVVNRDRRTDVALLRYDGAQLSAAPIARRPPRPGDALFVVGTPLDLSLSHTVTQGILSAVREVDGRRLYQTDATINRGNSGGPVFDASGELVALSVSGLFSREGSSMGVSYLIPIEVALQAVGAGGG